MLSEIFINKKNFLTNLKTIRKIIGPQTKLMAVVKANAYGHDLKLIASLANPLVDYFGVVETQEALLLRRMGIKKPILVLSYTALDALDSTLLKRAIKNNIELSIYDLLTAKRVSQIAKLLNKKAIIHLKIESGLNRLGFQKNDLKIIQQMKKLPYLKIKGIFSHLAAVEEKKMNYSKYQLQNFQKMIENFKKEEIINADTICHLAASAAALIWSASRFQLVRCGISLYGLYPSLEMKKWFWRQKIFLKPVLSWQTKVLAVKNVKKGSYIGYGCSYQAKKPTKIAVLAVGYADGYPRLLSNQGRVIIHNQWANIIGRVAMNMMVIDVSKIKKSVKIGDRAILIGQSQDKEISADELALKTKTINYEITTRINWQILRKLI